jgi:hypothetical protein
MLWHEKKIIGELRRLHKAGVELSYNRLAGRQQALVSAAAYHFGSFRQAVAKAGIDYAAVLRRPRWTKGRIVALIRQARQRGQELHWSAVTQRDGELRRAAFASLQRRLFGQWDKALHASGLDPEDISRYRKWGRSEVVEELKSRARKKSALNSGAIQAHDPGLHAAAVRYFSSFDHALRAAGLDPAKFRQRRRWTRQDVIATMRSVHKNEPRVLNGAVRQRMPALYGAAVRLFGGLPAARSAAGIAASKSTKRSKTSK